MKQNHRSNIQQQSSQDNLKCYYTTKYNFMQLSTEMLQSGQPYQRRVRADRVKEIINNFNPLYLDEIIVSFRDGKYWVVDGQNRIAAFKQMNGGKHCLVKCKVFHGLTYEEEAEMFYHLDKIRGKLKYNERVQARKESGDPDIQNIERIINSNGLRWKLNGAGSGTDRVISCSKVPVDCYEKYGPYVLDTGIKLLVRTWDGDKETLSSQFIKGICLFVHTYAQEIKEDVFVQKLSKFMPREIKSLARQETAVERQDIKYARVFLNKYNYKASGKRLEYRFKE